SPRLKRSVRAGAGRVWGSRTSEARARHPSLVVQRRTTVARSRHRRMAVSAPVVLRAPPRLVVPRDGAGVRRTRKRGLGLGPHGGPAGGWLAARGGGPNNRLHRTPGSGVRWLGTVSVAPAPVKPSVGHQGCGRKNRRGTSHGQAALLPLGG